MPLSFELVTANMYKNNNGSRSASDSNNNNKSNNNNLHRKRVAIAAFFSFASLPYTTTIYAHPFG